jgi:hypothetical protein
MPFYETSSFSYCCTVLSCSFTLPLRSLNNYQGTSSSISQNVRFRYSICLYDIRGTFVFSSLSFPLIIGFFRRLVLVLPACRAVLYRNGKVQYSSTALLVGSRSSVSSYNNSFGMGKLHYAQPCMQHAGMMMLML